MDRILDRVGNRYRLCSLGDLNRWIIDRMRAGINGAFGVPREKGNGRRKMKFFNKRGLCMDNTYLKYRSLHKYTRVAKGQDRVEISA